MTPWSDAGEAMGEDAAAQVLGELALDVARPAAAVGITYFEVTMSEFRTPTTALASGRQGPATQRQLATRPAAPARDRQGRHQPVGLATTPDGLLLIAMAAVGSGACSTLEGNAGRGNCA